MLVKAIGEDEVVALDQRLELFKRLIASCETILQDRSVDPEGSLRHLLLNRLRLRIAHAQQDVIHSFATSPDDTRAHKPVYLCIVKDIDSWILDPKDPAIPFTTPMATSSLIGVFYKESRTIYLRGDSGLTIESLTGVLIHELSHAADLLCRRSVSSWQSEWRARWLELETALEMSSSVWRPIVVSSSLSAEIYSRLEDSETLGTYNIPEGRAADEVMAHIWKDAALTRDEASYRRCLLSRAVVVSAAEQSSLAAWKRLAVTPGGPEDR